MPLRKTEHLSTGLAWAESSSTRGGAGLGQALLLWEFLRKREFHSKGTQKRWNGGSLGQACPNNGRFALPLNELQNRTTAKLLSATMSKALSSCTGFKGV